MEERAPYHTLAPKALRNLAAPLATWLREQGFTVTERHYDDTQATVGATWIGPRGDRFELAYIWSSSRHANATLQLQVRWPGQEPQNLFGSQRVHRLREVHLLVLGNVRYANACICDMHELLHMVLTPQLAMLSPLQEPKRRPHEVTAQHPRFREEAPLVLAGEQHRHHRYSDALTVAVTTLK